VIFTGMGQIPAIILTHADPHEDQARRNCGNGQNADIQGSDNSLLV
jgi:hypothetical protein